MEKSRLLKILGMPLVVFMLIASVSACGSDEDEATAMETQTATVEKGSIAVEITAAGNLELSKTEDLIVDIFYSEGTIGEVLVEEGDTVEAGQVLARLDTDEWNDELSNLEDTVTDREQSLADAQLNLLDAQEDLDDAMEFGQTELELAVSSAEASLYNAQKDLGTAVTSTDYDAALAALMKAKAHYEYVQSSAADPVLDEDGYTALERAEEQYKEAQAAYDLALTGYDSTQVSVKKAAVASAELSLAKAQNALSNYDQSVTKLELKLAQKQGALDDAEKALADAQESLDEANNMSPDITAPFDGFVTSVKVEGGDEVMNGTVAIQVADPDQFEANILVSEMDIFQVDIGTAAWVEVDAVSGLTLPAEVTHISPTATVSSGVVNYTVRVELLSTEEMMQQRQDAMEAAMADIAASGELPPPIQQAVEAGEMTQEEAEAMMQERQANIGDMTPMAGTINEDYDLKEGLNVTVTVVVEEVSDVLVVPYAAVTTMGGQSTVQVVNEAGETESRTVQTGTTDYSYIEITDGLVEGEEVIVPQGTVITSTSAEGQMRGGMMMFGGPPR